MTFAEIDRAIEAKQKAEKRKATFDYILADLIGRSVARVHNAANKMPTLAEAYPTLFSAEVEEEKLQEQKDELSAIRFELFAKSFNERLKEVSKKE